MDNMESARGEIESVLGGLIEAWNRHDVDTYCQYWVEDADFVNVIGMRHQGREKIQDELAWLHAGRFSKTTMRILGYSIRFLYADAAVVHVHWQLDGDPGMPGHPSQNGTRRGVFTHVVQRTAAGWRFIASQNTDRLLVAEQRPASLTMPDVGAAWAAAYA
jgi:uncharacterized protein (TIGR02246 family)